MLTLREPTALEGSLSLSAHKLNADSSVALSTFEVLATDREQILNSAVGDLPTRIVRP